MGKGIENARGCEGIITVLGEGKGEVVSLNIIRGNVRALKSTMAYSISGIVILFICNKFCQLLFFLDYT
jgi:hypothetical protein